MSNISYFVGKYEFLDNFYPAPFTYNGLEYYSAESAFQAQRCVSIDERIKISNMHSREARKASKRIEARADWDNNMMLSVMQDILLNKFEQNPELLKLLLKTKNQKLEYGNNIGDTFWGVCKGQGNNHLGELLMQTRDLLVIAKKHNWLDL